MSRVLVVEDESAIAELIAINLRHAGHEVVIAQTADQAQIEIDGVLPDLVLLDWMLPGRTGLDWARTLRANARTRELPIIMLTARADEADKVAGLEAWVDDYVTKPFSPRELKARIKAVLRRRAPEAAQEPLEVGPLKLDPGTHRVTAHGAAVALGPTEFRLLRFFLARPERVHTRMQLLDAVWGTTFEGYEHTVNTHINRLRSKIETDPANPRYVLTVRGVGYRFTDQR